MAEEAGNEVVEQINAAQYVAQLGLNKSIIKRYQIN